ncbi:MULTISPECIES: hypothetical protein [Pseudoalteromonas]|uniref:Uncharacterized protein n=1 Tax=Pseudoalteromonas amylolytica TaxID=1859457 RepID=A0A1S1MW78_9GAMM|nr:MULTISPECIES: hypothetical protein [Pseudoalteromonas]OHU87823.1 hypothetical protein BFC16_10440 [Pseudoalteromonas sp. JW3]OHU91263.1 hypothetical protein BET10_10560 [Pseudoalteromonas amylolytica]
MTYIYETIEGQRISEPAPSCYQLNVNEAGNIFEKTLYNPQPKNLVVTLSNVTVECGQAALVGNIWWLPKGERFILRANVSELADTQLMVMVERVINAEQPIDDIRFVAEIVDGVFTMQGCFELSGNYLITPSRLNAGLERIGAPFRLAFSALEFDAYMPEQTS